MKKHYPVIIAGGGPVGAAMAIELGLQGIETLVLEKNIKPLLTPRAQYLNARTIDLLTRWGIIEPLRAQQLLPKYIPMATAWQNTLAQSPLAIGTVSEQGLRIPLYITEQLLREKISTLPSVTFTTEQAVIKTELDAKKVVVTSKEHNDKGKNRQFTADYLLACDGANSIVRKQMQIPFVELGPKNQTLSVLFTALDLHKKIEKTYMMHLCIRNEGAAGIGPIDLDKGVWYAQIPYRDPELPTKSQVSHLLNELAGFAFKKDILIHHFWMMQIQLAENFSKNERVFLIGDSAHAFAPTGGLGLNTALADATNLAWKLAAVIRGEARQALLSTYEYERRPIAIRNLQAAERNAQNRLSAQNQSNSLEKIANIHGNAGGLTRGYAYLYSNLTRLQPLQSLETMPHGVYTPTAEPGYFIPEIKVENESIYTMLSPTNWTLLVIGRQTQPVSFPANLCVLQLPENSYPHAYMLLRPDWHVAEVFSELPDELSVPMSELP